MNYDDMSDAELDAALAEPNLKATKTNYDDMSDSELDAALRDSVRSAPNERPWYDVNPQGLWQGIKNIPETIDSVTGAPVRKFLTEAVTGETMDKAPSGRDQAIKMGMNDVSYKEQFGVPSWLGGNVTPADVAGVELEIAQDPFVIGSMAKKAAGIVGKGAVDAVKSFDNWAMGGTSTGRQVQQAGATAEGVARAGAEVSGGSQTVEQSGKLFDFKPPQSLDELREWKPPTAGADDIPGKGRLLEIEKSLPDLETRPLKYHHDMMDNPKAMKKLKLDFENLPTEDAQKIASYNQTMVNESADKVRKTVKDISGDFPMGPAEAGESLIADVKRRYHMEKDALGPMFERLKKFGGDLTPNEAQQLIVDIGEKSKLGKILVQDEVTGRLSIKGNTPRTGLSDQEHGILSRVIDDLNDGMTFKEVQDTRDFLRKHIDPSNPKASEELQNVRSILLDKLEEMTKSRGPDVHSTFKAYAVNERARESFEKIIGGKIESLDSMYRANPDKVLQKIFSNPNYTQVVERYVGKEKMQEMIASHLSSGVEMAFDGAKGFQPHKLRAWLKSKNNQSFLNNNVSPEVIERLNALADYGYYGKRFLDEVNPSGTAASLQAMLEPKSFFTKVSQQGPMAAVSSEVGQRLNAFTKQRQSVKATNEALGKINPDIVSNLMNKFGANFPAPNGNDVMKSGLAARAISENRDQEKPKSGIDKTSIISKTNGTKYSQVLQKAAANGDAAFSSAHFVLSQRDENYRKLMEKK